jgi:protein translocase SecG subunit
MLNGILSFFFALLCILLILMILIQKGKSSLGIGSISGNNQMLFGGGGGQNLFQKITWVLGLVLIFGSVSLSTLKYKTNRVNNFNYSAPTKNQN